MSVKFIAHIRQADKSEQSVATHLTETAAIARELAAKLDLSAAGKRMVRKLITQWQVRNGCMVV